MPEDFVSIETILQFDVLSSADSYQLAPEETRVLSETETGHITARDQYTAIYDDVSVKWLLSGVQMEVFRRWFRQSIKNGTLWFPLEIPVGIEACRNVPKRMCFFRSSPPWQAVRKGEYWEISANLRVNVYGNIG